MSIVKMEVPEEQPPVQATTSALVVPPPRTVAAYLNEDDAEGEFDRSDRQNAMLVIVAKTGELSNLFTPGDLLVNKEFVIGGTKAPLEIVPIAIKKRYQNDLDYEDGEMGDCVDKALEVTDRGGMLGYRPFGDKATHFWKPILQVLFLIKRPEGLSPAANAIFPFQVDGSDYGRIGYVARTKTAYNGIAKTLIGAKQDNGSVRMSTYQLSTKGETWNGKSWIQANLRVIRPTSETMLDFISKLPK